MDLFLLIYIAVHKDYSLITPSMHDTRLTPRIQSKIQIESCDLVHQVEFLNLIYSSNEEYENKMCIRLIKRSFAVERARDWLQPIY